jgi:hypothetical protein
VTFNSGCKRLSRAEVLLVVAHKVAARVRVEEVRAAELALAAVDHDNS